MLDERSKSANDRLRHSDLLVNRAQEVFSADWGNIREGYTRGYIQIYCLVETSVVAEEKHRFPFLITQNEVSVVWPVNNCSGIAGKAWHAGADLEATSKLWDDFDKNGAMLEGVCDFIDPPEQIIPSRVWSLGLNESPLFGRELLFNSVLPGHPFAWEDIWLPRVHVFPPEWKANSGSPMPVFLDELEDCGVERRAQSFNNTSGVPPQVLRDVQLLARDYIRSSAVVTSFDGVRLVAEEPVDRRFQLVKFAFSTSDMLV